MGFVIVLFEDGLSLVPTSWLSSNKTYCFYPRSKKESTIRKLMSCEVFPKPNDPEWVEYPVQRIMGETGKI